MGNEFIKSKVSDIEFGSFPVFSRYGVVNAVSFRTGGKSKNPYTSLNLALHTNDNTDTVIENRELFFSVLNINYKDIITLKQIHSDKIFTVSENDRGRGALDYENSLGAGDGLITSDLNTPLVIFTADCLSVFFLEYEKRIIGVVHSGWKGTFLNIAGKMVEEIEKLGGNPENIIAGIGPGIEQKCYEVGSEFLDKFNEKYIEIKNKKYYFDMVMVNYDNLVKAGVKPENIFKSEMCTYCNEKELYSYRRDGETGRMASVIMLR